MRFRIPPVRVLFLAVFLDLILVSGRPAPSEEASNQSIPQSSPKTVDVMPSNKLAAVQAAFLNPPSDVKTIGDISFLDPGRNEKMDLYLPAGRSPATHAPAVVLIHGGGWIGGDKREAREVEIGTTLAQNGFVVASINYAMKTAGKYPLNLQDCKNAVRYLRSKATELGIDPERIAVLGGSAGGHLALMVAYTGDDSDLAPSSPYPGVSDKVAAVVDMYGVTDIGSRKKIDSSGNPTGPREVESHVREIFGETPVDWAKASPVNHINAKVPPSFIVHGRKDKTVDRDQSQELADALRKAGCDVTLVWLENAGHTFSFKYSNTRTKAPLDRDIGPEIVTFLKKNLK